MHKIGDIIKGREIGRKGDQRWSNFVWTSCPICGYERFVEENSLKRQSIFGRCHRCRMVSKYSDSSERQLLSDTINTLYQDDQFRKKQHFASEQNASLPDSREKRRIRLLELWKDNEYVSSVMAGRILEPNQCELKLDSILKELSLPYEFVGDGKLIIGGKCPDFANVNGQKKIIELFGDYWHSEAITGHSIEKEEQERIDHFASLGFKTLIIWESELSNIDILIQKILSFDRRCRNACTSKA